MGRELHPAGHTRRIMTNQIVISPIITLPVRLKLIMAWKPESPFLNFLCTNRFRNITRNLLSILSIRRRRRLAHLPVKGQKEKFPLGLCPKRAGIIN
jgi:hypothetical protein